MKDSSFYFLLFLLIDLEGGRVSLKKVWEEMAIIFFEKDLVDVFL